ncbi:hypothetical protein B484DRAFT_420368 [Ochromonadaceae sp. CCMP2298]|nr:hypothetical protein B484DRAFT_420368 [Ochromonadaceae sp. CCMP2298]
MMIVAIALLNLVLCWLSLTEAAKAAEDAGMPRAIIHIGPHKTGTTSLQAMLTSAYSIANMRGENTYWMKQSEVLHFSRALSEVRQGFDDLKDMLQGFDVAIVAVYREYIAHIQVFGKDALKVVDYYGAIAAGKSVPHVVLCEVGGVLCAMKEAAHATRLNVSPGTMAEQQLFTNFLHFIMQTGKSPCQPPPANVLKHTDIVNLFLKEYEKQPASPLPTLAINLTALVEHSVAWDTTVRKIFGDMVYGNASANLQHALSAHVEELDFDKLLYNNEWTSWMRGVYDKAADQKLLCDSNSS